MHIDDDGIKRSIGRLSKLLYPCASVRSLSIGDGHQPNSRGLYTYYKDFIKGGMTAPSSDIFQHIIAILRSFTLTWARTSNVNLAAVQPTAEGVESSV